MTDSIELDMGPGAEIVLNVMGEVGPRGTVGPAGDPGPAGVDGRTVLHGPDDPVDEGLDGDFYINELTWIIFGPKAADTWPAGVPLVGPIGPAGSAGSSAPTTVQLTVSDPDIALTTGDGKAYWTVPRELDGCEVSAVEASVITPSTSGAPAVQLTNVTKALPILSTQATVDAGEATSYTATDPSVVDIANNTLATGEQLRVDVTDAGTDTQGLFVLVTVTPIGA